MDSIEAKICRLCFSTRIHLIDIFNESNAEIRGIIEEHIGEVKYPTQNGSDAS